MTMYKVKNELIIVDYRSLSSILDFLKTDKSLFDFNKITTKPIWVKESTIENQDKYTADNCELEWYLANWGTIKNAFNVEINENIIKFTTEWNSPLLLIRKLSIIFSEIIFLLKFNKREITIKDFQILRDIEV
jgi:hypothetical protein